MKYKITSDIHLNPVALTTVLADGKKEDVGRWISCGDVMGYGYNASVCVNQFRARGHVWNGLGQGENGIIFNLKMSEEK